jgi:hypothetical protein
MIVTTSCQDSLRHFFAVILGAGTIIGVLADNPRTFGQASGDANTKVVEVSGAGVDVEGAKRDACREAVRQVVGAYVASKTRTDNDELIEDRVISLSAGLVEKVETLKESSADGLVRVRIRATVQITKLLDTLRENNIAVASVDGMSLGAKLVTIKDQKRGTEEVVAAALEGFPAKWFKANIKGEPRLGEQTNGRDVSVIVTIEIESDIEGFKDSITKLDEALKQTKRASGEFLVDGAKTPGQSASSAKESADSCIRGLLQAQVASATYFLCGRNLPELESFPLERHTDIPVMFPIKFHGQGPRTTWHWYALTEAEAIAFIAPLFKQSLKCRVVLANRQGEEVGVDAFEIPFMGVGGMCYWEPHNLQHRAPVALAPAAMPGQFVDILDVIGKFQFEKAVPVNEADISDLQEVAVSLH